MRRYKVLAPCVVHIPMNTDRGVQLGTLYQNTVFVGDPASDKMKFLVDAEMIEPLDDGDSPAKDSGEEQASLQAESGGPSMPPENGPGSGKDAWVEYAVGSGRMERPDAEGLSKTELVKTLKGE
ncbi:hypothetical protein [Actinomadura litoris]|uniref:Uncharacterized protein n=1 Tax=Actinomadura litoris TaxID=2678616 RepID=A0A7K1LAE8_9ACTN|nr:hypothetical protein [Actinomadura litoris]MUN41411.1 hypothetical protein [Actinomadura litoris]